MTITLPWQGTGSRRAVDQLAAVKTENKRLLADNAEVIAANSDLECAVHKALRNALCDEMRIAQAEQERDAAVAQVRALQRRVIADAAHLARLRQAVIHARPRITEVPCELVRPYSPEVVLPYVSPVPHHDTSGETTQALAIVDLPQGVK